MKSKTMVSLGLIAILVLLGGPRDRFPIQETAAKGCGNGTGRCCCGVAGGCGMCPTEQAEAAQKESAELIIKVAGCPGPVRDAGAPGDGPRFILPSLASIGFLILVVGRIPQEMEPSLDSRPAAPDPPPPRSSFISF